MESPPRIELREITRATVRDFCRLKVKPEAGLENATMVRERINDAEDRKAFDLIMSQQEYGRPFALPPNVPAVQPNFPSASNRAYGGSPIQILMVGKRCASSVRVFRPDFSAASVMACKKKPRHASQPRCRE